MGYWPAKRRRGDEIRPAKLHPDSLFYILRGNIPPSQSFINGFNCRLREYICWACSGGGRTWSPSSCGDLRWRRYCCRLQNLTSGCHCQVVAPVQLLLGEPPPPAWGQASPRLASPHHATLLYSPGGCFSFHQCLHSARLPPPQMHRIHSPRPPTHQPPTPAEGIQHPRQSEAAQLLDWSLL